MGSAEAEMARQAASPREVSWGRPRHRVEIDRPFAMSAYMVTREEWDACVAAGACPFAHLDEHRPDRQDTPVAGVSWRDAEGYVAWLNGEARASGGDGFYRLPSEAEWEYAARAGTTTAHWWDATTRDDPDGWPSYFSPPPVHHLAANPFGLHGMLGGFWQWTEDCWNDSYAAAPRDAGARLTGNCEERVVRGGEMYGHPPRADQRSWHLLSLRSRDTGFRVVKDLPQ